METFHSIAVVLLLIGVLVAFLKDRWPPDLVALSAFAIVLALGIVKIKDAAAIFGNEALITIGSMFVLSKALEKTGALQVFAEWIRRFSQEKEIRVLLVLAAIVIPLSAFVNNTAIVVMFLPVLLGFSRESGIKASRLLIPLSFFSILGGTITLLGTSTNLVVNGVITNLGLKPIGVFEISFLGLIYAVTGSIYFLTLGRKLLPDRDANHQVEPIEDFPVTATIDKKHALITTSVILGVIILAAFGVAPIALLAFIGAVLVAATGCLRHEQMYRAVDWRILFLIIGMLGLGKALEETNLIAFAAKHLAGTLAGAGPIFLLATIYLLASLTTEVITNTAVAILLTPVAVTTATQLEYDPRGFIVAIMFGASASFMTPIGYQTNTYIYGTGCYRFGDFFRVGFFLQLLLGIVAVLLIPKIWPF